MHNLSGKTPSLRRLLVIISLIALAVILAACQAPATSGETGGDTGSAEPSDTGETGGDTGGSEGGTETVTVWGFVWTADWLDAIAGDFEAQHPGVKVQVERFEYDPYQDMVLTTLASGEGVPDVVTLDPMWAGDLIRGGTVLPLDKAEEELPVGDFVPGGYNLYAWQGVQYGVPLDLDFNLMFYRKDVYGAAMEKLGMTEFPTNTEDFITLAKQVTEDTGKPAILLAQGDYYGWYQSFLAPMGGNLINDAGTEYVYNSPEAVEALQLYSDLANVHGVGKLWGEADGDSDAAMANGDVMARMAGSWYATQLASVAPDMAGQWAIAPLPFGEEGREFTAATGGACLSIPTGAKNPDMAWEFIKFTMTPENQAKYFQIVGGVPSLKTAWTDPSFDAMNEYFDIPLGRSVADWSLHVMPMQLPSLEVADLIGEAITRATTGDASVEDALNDAVAGAPPLE